MKQSTFNSESKENGDKVETTVAELDLQLEL